MKQKIASSVLALLLTVLIFTGCSQNENSHDGNQMPPGDTAGSSEDNANGTQNSNDKAVQLIYYTIGTPPADLGIINEELSRMTLEKVNAAVNLIFVDWGDYETKITAIINSGTNYDIAFMSDYLGNAKRGAYEPLDDLLQKYGQGILKAINPLFWEGVRVDGKIYGIPTNKEIATPQWWMYPKELVEKYNIDIRNIKTIEDLEPWFEKLKVLEPEWQLMDLDQDSYFYWGYEYLLIDVPAVINLSDPDLAVRNLYEEERIVEVLHTLRRYFKAGYINQDAAIKPPSGLVRGEKVFWKQAQGGPYADVIWTKDKGFPVVAVQAEEAIVTTESTRGAIVTVSSKSRNKVKAVQFLNLVNTDPDVRNTLGYGIEGLHYEVVKGKVDKVKFLEASSRYVVPNYSLGNRFIMYPTVDDPDDLWEKYKAFNDAAVKSPILGFVPDIEPIKNEIAAVADVHREFRPALMTGSVEVEENLNKLKIRLKEAGLDVIIETLQAQIDEWKSQQQQ
ncbi:MAG TPA: extracellular solute-binding protein [Clostridiales bacterium]|nr:extracellular solute-binding protein [Clostridiales bacterium]